MLKSYFRLLLFCVLCFTAGAARAETLLATITHNGHAFNPAPSPIPALMSFGIATHGPGVDVGMSREYTTADVGMTFDATQSEVAAINGAFTNPDGFVGITTMTDHHERDLGDFWTWQFVTPNVPQLGFGLTGYQLSRITQTVDSITWSTATGPLVGTAQQTIRLYGNVVPEPPLISLLVLAVGHLSVRRIR